jgi:signal transduction histidine kinase
MNGTESMSGARTEDGVWTGNAAAAGKAAVGACPPHAETIPIWPDVLQQRKRVLLSELKDRSLWFVRIRWWVPLGIALGVAVARLLGIVMPAAPLLAIAALIGVYNLVFWRWSGRLESAPAAQIEMQLRRFAHWQVGLDYAAMFLFVHYTGGAASPFIFFFIFHIIFASILLQRKNALRAAVAVAIGMGLLTLAEASGWLPHHPLIYRGHPIEMIREPLPLLVAWAFFAAAVIFSTLATSHVRKMVRKRIYDLAELSEEVMTLNDRLGSLYTIGQFLVSLRRLEPVLEAVCAELARVMNVQGISVKLLGGDGRRLHYVAAHGLPVEITREKVIDVELSPLNRRIIEGEAYVTGEVTQQEFFQLGEELSAAELRSVLFVPLRNDGNVIGILGAYGRRPQRFQQAEVDFLTLAAEIVAIAVDNARAYEAVEEASRDRQRFTLKAAHNLRAPLVAILSMLEVIRDGHIGQLNDAQREYLRRIERRATTLTELINELLLLAESQSAREVSPFQDVDLAWLVGRLQRTFQDGAAQKGVVLSFEVAPDALPVVGDAEMLERLLENLISNAIKYTPARGRVAVECRPGTNGMVRLTVADTGIGIPTEDHPRLFTEFFRAANARAIEDVGTGLGLVIARDIVDHHGGRIEVQSRLNEGTTFTIDLPAAPQNKEGIAHGHDS